MKHLLIVLFLMIYGNSFAPNTKGTDAIRQKESQLRSYQNFLIDKRVEALQLAIKSIESTNYEDIGLSGEYGAYQYLPETWAIICTLLFNEVLDITIPANQDLVTKARIKRLVSKGYTDKQIASIWNCGSSQYENKIGINQFGVPYNVPQYVEKVIKQVKPYNYA